MPSLAGSKVPIPNSANWIVLVDECHRTQEKDLGAFLAATLPDAHFYGFTGTPIKSTDKDTYLRSLRQQVRRILTDLGIGETKAIREKVEEFAIHAYGGGA